MCPLITIKVIVNRKKEEKVTFLLFFTSKRVPSLHINFFIMTGYTQILENAHYASSNTDDDFVSSSAGMYWDNHVFGADLYYGDDI